jgi:diacylglycerol kinase family enzyme
VVRHFQAIAFGNHPELEDVEYFQSRVVQVSSSSSVPVELDGELAGMLPFRFSIDNLRLRVLAPA